MNTHTLHTLVMQTLQDTQGIDILSADVRSITALTDCMMICSGSSIRHIHTLTEHVVKAVKQQRHTPIRTEGQANTGWMLVDLGNIIVHIMLTEVRQLYRLEDLWFPLEEESAMAAN